MNVLDPGDNFFTIQGTLRFHRLPNHQVGVTWDNKGPKQSINLRVTETLEPGFVTIIDEDIRWYISRINL